MKAACFIIAVFAFISHSQSLLLRGTVSNVLSSPVIIRYPTGTGFSVASPGGVVQARITGGPIVSLQPTIRSISNTEMEVLLHRVDLGNWGSSWYGTDVSLDFIIWDATSVTTNEVYETFTAATNLNVPSRSIFWKSFPNSKNLDSTRFALTTIYTPNFYGIFSSIIRFTSHDGIYFQYGRVDQAANWNTPVLLSYLVNNVQANVNVFKRGRVTVNPPAAAEVPKSFSVDIQFSASPQFLSVPRILASVEYGSANDFSDFFTITITSISITGFSATISRVDYDILSNPSAYIGTSLIVNYEAWTSGIDTSGSFQAFFPTESTSVALLSSTAIFASSTAAYESGVSASAYAASVEAYEALVSASAYAASVEAYEAEVSASAYAASVEAYEAEVSASAYAASVEAYEAEVSASAYAASVEAYEAEVSASAYAASVEAYEAEVSASAYAASVEAYEAELSASVISASLQALESSTSAIEFSSSLAVATSNGQGNSPSSESSSTASIAAGAAAGAVLLICLIVLFITLHGKKSSKKDETRTANSGAIANPLYNELSDSNSNP